jgi:hypothetical protein
LFIFDPNFSSFVRPGRSGLSYRFRDSENGKRVEVMTEETAKELLEQLKRGQIREIYVKKEDFPVFRQVLVQREDFGNFRGIAQKGGGVIFHYLPKT